MAGTGLWKVDMHSHTRLSKDSLNEPRLLVEAAARKGLQALCVTDHNGLANALALTSTMDTDVIRATVLGSDFEAPQGRVSVSAATSHTNLWSRVGRVNGRGQFEIMQQSAMPVWPDPFLVGRGDAGALVRP